ncbi:thioredoxin reductase 1, cytoplasmic-like [Homarus americanus]|uniref:thioredoxin reductase 1, cytoplasmic-like n=1 Tax=Homarus americanus TaxID=6706 RepID=UPI001C45CA7B|nr:thioredoxin reductase 1, cytoplasmic-like [Homarus americanus]
MSGVAALLPRALRYSLLIRSYRTCTTNTTRLAPFTSPLLAVESSWSRELSRRKLIVRGEGRKGTVGVCSSAGLRVVGSESYSTMAPITTQGLTPLQVVENSIKENKVMVFSKSYCPFCHKVKDLLNQLNVEYTTLELDQIENGSEVQHALTEISGQRTVPNVYINGEHLGGADKTFDTHAKGELLPLINKSDHTYDYDLVVIGGGSGGLAASKHAADLGAKVAVCDFVKPTPKGTTWGLGGTCVNVGCIPKKLMHQAAILGHDLKDSREYGWVTPETVTHDWNKMVEGIQSHIGSLNWGYRVALRDKKVTYLNAYATFTDEHTLKTVDRRGKEKVITSDKFLLAMGGRPRYPDIPGAKEHCITSDDIFSLPHPPGKTLLVGASYIALECAGFLAGLGYDTTVMVRSILLRGFDQQIAENIGAFMEKNGVKFIRGAVPTSVEEVEEGTPGKLKVTAKTTDGEEITDEYNTVVVAIGRDPCTADISLHDINVEMAKSGKVVVNKEEQTSVPHIYAVGDIIEGGLELTPVAIQAGRLLAKRLYGNGKLLTDYVNVPTTVFTPLEYGCCGLSEETAIEKYGEDDIEVYHSNYQPLEYTIAHRPENDCYAKLICVKSENERVVGFHVLGPNAGEITQGFGLGLKLKATKADFDNLIGIHPTTAEIFTTLNITKRSGKAVDAQGC